MKRFFIITILATVALMGLSCGNAIPSISNIELTKVEVHNGLIDAILVVDMSHSLPRAVDLHAAQVNIGLDTLLTVTLAEPLIIPAKTRQVSVPIRIRLVKPFQIMALMGSSDKEIHLRMNATARIGNRDLTTFTVERSYPMKDLRQYIKNYLEHLQK